MRGTERDPHHAPVVQLAQSCPLQPAGGELRLDQFFEGASGEYSTSAAGTDWREVHLLGARLSNDNPLPRNESQRPWWLLHFLPRRREDTKHALHVCPSCLRDFVVAFLVGAFRGL